MLVIHTIFRDMTQASFFVQIEAIKIGSGALTTSSNAVDSVLLVVAGRSSVEKMDSLSL